MNFASRWALAITASAALASGCGATSNAYQGQVVIPIQVGSADVVQGEVWALALNPLSSYDAFIAAASSRFGSNPSRIEVRSASLRLLPSSTGVSRLEDVVTGSVSVLFAMAAPSMYDAAQVTSPTGSGPVALNVQFRPSSVSAMDMTHLCAGSLDVYLRGRAATGFDPTVASARLELVLDLTAVE